MRAVVAAVMVFVLSLTAWAQSTETYLLQPDDVVRIQVFNQQQIAVELPIGRDGRVSAPFAGMIMAAGKTTAEVERELVDIYKERLKLRDPIVSVMVVRFRTTRATVGGAVLRPNTYELRPGDRLLSLLNLGGGIDDTRADPRRATLRRKGSPESIPIDLYALLRGDTSQNYLIQDGDELTVPPDEAGLRIVVLGAVQRPGAFAFRDGLRLSDSIALAGGEIRFRTRFSRTQILRRMPGRPGQYERIEANFVRFIRNFDSAQNVELKPGDLVYIPETDTPDFQQIAAIANVVFILDRLGGGLFGINIFGN